MIRRGFELIVCVCASQAATPVDQNTIRRRGTGLRAFNPGKSIRRWGRQPFRLTKPWKIRQTWELAAGEEVHEYICNENERDASHLKGK